MPKKIDVEKAVRAANEDADIVSLDGLAKLLAGVPKRGATPVSVVVEPQADGEAGPSSWDRQLLDPAIIELVLSLDLPVRVPAGDPRTYTFWLYRWASRDPHPFDELRRVAAHPFFGEVLVASFFPTRETKGEVGNWVARAVRTPDVFRRVFAALDAFGEALNETWTLGALKTHTSWIENLCQPALFAQCPSLARAVREMDVARLLRNQLRGGIMDEWGWPAYEQALDHFPKDEQRDIATEVESGVLPYKVLLDKKRGRVIVVGPDEMVLDRALPAAKKMTDVRVATYVAGDVLICEYRPLQARWIVAGGEPFKMDMSSLCDLACDGGVVTKARNVMHPGDRKVSLAPKSDRTRDLWFDGTTYYALPQETVVRADGTACEGAPGAETFDPKTGKTTGHGLPAWMAACVGDGELVVHIQGSFTVPSPKGAERSPLGAKDGFTGFALHRHGGTMTIEGIDGRTARGQVNGLYAIGLMTFPAREGFYPIVQSAFDLGVAMPDGTTPLVPMDRLKWEYWWGTPGLGSLRDWLALQPRDLAASKMLAECTDEAAKAIVAMARAPASGDESIPTELADAIVRALPAVKHPRMIDGIAKLAQTAVKSAAVVMRLKSRAKPPGPTSSLLNEHAAALSRLFAHERHWWVEKLGVQLGQQMLDVSHFLFDAEASERVLTPAPTVVPWTLLLTRMGEVLYRVIAPGTPKLRRAELVEVLALWLQTGFPSSLTRVRIVDLSMSAKCEELAGLDRNHAQRLVAWKGRYFFHFGGEEKESMKLHGVEVAGKGGFATPEGATIHRIEAPDARFDADVIRKTLALFAEHGTAEFDRSIAERIAQKTKLSKTAATLLWCAGYDPWLIGDKKQARFEIARAALDDAEKELRVLPLAQIYVHAMPDDPEQMYDGAVMADRLVAALAACKR